MYTLGHIWVNLVGQYALNQAFKSSLDGDIFIPTENRFPLGVS